MRPIKLKVWDVMQKEMTYFETLREFCEYQAESCNATIELQFAGLLDKNKVELYFDDIVKFKFKDGSDSYFGTARIVETVTFGVGIHYDRPSDESPDCFAVAGGGMIEDIWEDEDLWELELIGNIYENPELLTQS